ncbi:MAG: DUF4870 domain-containing protein [Clostridia bacterium]|nr:DUF4870 domain-containing protein [Clostridia bacterium]
MTDINVLIDKLMNTADMTELHSPDDISHNRIKSAFSYLSWLVLIPLFAAKESSFARFHAARGLNLALAETGAVILVGLLSRIKYIGAFFSVAGGIVFVCCFILSVLGLINVCKGQAKVLPLAEKIRIRKK